MQHMRWCDSLLGQEYARAHSWGSAPTTTLVREDVVVVVCRHVRFRIADLSPFSPQPVLLNSSPCQFVELPQTVMEPLFIKYATDHGITCRFSTKLLSVERKDGFVWSSVEDLVTPSVYQVKSRYIFGCDGGRSTVTRSLEFKFKSAPSGGVACNILLGAYVSDHRMLDRFANLHWIMQPRNRKFGTGPVIRMVKPWYQWMIVCFTPDAVQDPFQGLTPDSPELIQYVKDLFGDPNIDIKILRLDPWTIRESVAEKFSDSYDVFMVS